MIDDAERDLLRLRNAKSSVAAREAWVSFLEHANRAVNRLEGYSRRTNQTKKYEELTKREIWATDLTRYMRTARNAHEHGVEDLEIADPHNERIVFPNGVVIGSPVAYAKTDRGPVTMVAAAPMEFWGNPGLEVISLKPGIRMVAIVDRKGETMLPPLVQLGAANEPEAFAAARLYLGWVIEQIGAFD